MSGYECDGWWQDCGTQLRYVYLWLWRIPVYVRKVVFHGVPQ